MQKLMRYSLAGISSIVVAGLVLYFTGLAQPVMFGALMTVYSPDEPFDGNGVVPAPDYADDRFWAALPTKSDPADLVPPGVPETAEKLADVFFIHPTGYLSGASWTSPMDPDSAAEENTRWMMANQASAYNGCCDVYAPRYREASIFAYFSDSRDAVLDFAYRDVAAAFDYFLANRDKNRPFLIASHSQGTHHARRLLQEKIDGTPLVQKLVAAYLIGSVNIELSDSYFATLDDISPCRDAHQLACVIHWDTFAEGSEGLKRTENSLCTNPLTWRTDEDRAPANLNHGAVPILVPYDISFDRDNAARGVVFDTLGTPLPGHTWAQCRNGTLFVENQRKGPLSNGGQGGNYHGLDYNLFYMDIRDNAILRTRAWWSANELASPRAGMKPSG